MKPLPQRKKSPEELAKLRETFGIRPAPPDAPSPPELSRPATGSNAPDAPPPAAAAMAPDDAPPQVHTRPHWRTFKRSDHSPLAPADTPRQSAAAPTAPFGLPRTPAVPAATSHPLKPLRPLQLAAAAAPPSADSTLPRHRHSAQELAQARRRDAQAVISHGAYQLPTATHPALLACGYVLVIGGAAAPTLLDLMASLTDSYTLGRAWGQGYHLLSGATLAALAIAALIFVRNTLSRHHAAFIAIIGFFALVFALIHYLSLLRHAT